MKHCTPFFSLVTFSFLVFLLATPAVAASPDGLGPWADTMVSVSQGLTKNGSTVPLIRSNNTSALGVAENDLVEGNFFSLGFGGNIVLGFDNGISSGAMIIETTNPGYPGETARVEMSEDGTTWVLAGTIVQDGTVEKPEALACARFVRITDISDPEIMPDDMADGFDVDGVQAQGENCAPGPTPTPSPTQSPTPTPTPTSTPTVTPTPVPGFPNTGTCSPSTITTLPIILSARRESPTSIFISWGPFAGFNDFIVEYGVQNGNWQFSTKVNGFSTTLNSLPANQSFWVRVAATDNCIVGPFGGAILVGGTTAVTTNVPGFPNTGSLTPGLPNTGVDPGSARGLFQTIVFYLRQFLPFLQ